MTKKFFKKFVLFLTICLIINLFQVDSVMAADTTIPTIISTIPSNNPFYDIEPTDRIIIKYSEPIVEGPEFSSIILRDAYASEIVPITASINDDTLTIILDTRMDYSKLYELNYSNDTVEDTLGNACNLEAMQFYTVDAPDSVPPTVVDSSPKAGEINVSVIPVIYIFFSENIQWGNNVQGISYKDSDGNSMNLHLNLSGNELSLYTMSTLKYSTKYFVTLPVGSIVDNGGNTLSQDYVLEFTTQPAPDIIPPVVNSLTPVSGQSNVSITTSINVTFSENVFMGSTYNNITLSSQGVNTAFSASISGNVLTLTPLSPLAYNSNYLLTIPSGAVKDSAGNETASPLQSNFTTVAPPDTTPPTIINTSPASGSSNVATSTIITINFSENVYMGSTYNNITLSSQGVNTAFSASISGNVLTLTPLSPLAYNSNYLLTIPSGAVKDSAGNETALPLQSNFTTVAPPDTTPPTIINTSPASGSSNVATSTIITINFSENIKAGVNMGTIMLSKGTTGTACTINISEKQLIITPNISLSTKTTYTVSIPAGAVTDMSDNPLSSTYTYSFITGRK